MKNKEYLIFVIIGTVILLGLVFYKCDRKKESYKTCVCSSHMGRDRNCQDVSLVDSAYNSGVLTEFSDLIAPGWSPASASPGSYDFPSNTGCCGAQNPKSGVIPWQAWDYEELAD